MIAGKKRRRRSDDVRADINVTPLVDVVLVLLIIFMVVAPMISKGAAVELPRTAHHDRQPDDGKDLLVSVDRQGQIYLGAFPVNVQDLPGRVLEERRRAPTRKVYLQGDNLSRYGAVRAAMDAIRQGTRVDEVLLRTDARSPAAVENSGSEPWQ